jgi:hypothetical protein
VNRSSPQRSLSDGSTEAEPHRHLGPQPDNDAISLLVGRKLPDLGFEPLQGFPSRDSLWERIHDRDKVWEEIQEAVRQKKDCSGEFKIVLPSGTVKYLAAKSHHLFDTNGELVEVIGTNVDVTERKRAEEALRESDARLAEAQHELRQMIDTIPILVTDARRDFVNAAPGSNIRVFPTRLRSVRIGPSWRIPTTSRPVRKCGVTPLRGGGGAYGGALPARRRTVSLVCCRSCRFARRGRQGDQVVQNRLRRRGSQTCRGSIAFSN